MAFCMTWGFSFVVMIILLFLRYSLACLPGLMMWELGASCILMYSAGSILLGSVRVWHFQVQLVVMDEILYYSSVSGASCVPSDLPSLLLLSQLQALAMLQMSAAVSSCAFSVSLVLVIQCSGLWVYFSDQAVPSTGLLLLLCIFSVSFWLFVQLFLPIRLTGGILENDVVCNCVLNAIIFHECFKLTTAVLWSIVTDELFKQTVTCNISFHELDDCCGVQTVKWFYFNKVGVVVNKNDVVLAM